MPVTVVTGLQWGDEGKGKIVDMLSADYDIVARYQGGANAGHTVLIGQEEYILHLIPSGILRPNVLCALGAGVALDPEALIDEIGHLRERAIDIDGRLFLSDRATLIGPHHKMLDRTSEEAASKIGTTGRGIGPAYTDKYARLSARVADLARPKYLKARITESVAVKNVILKNLYDSEPIDADEMTQWFLSKYEPLKEYIADTGAMARDALKKGANILAEGAQGTALDIDHGTFPYVTSSSCCAGGVAPGLGIAPSAITRSVGILKAYATRVGEGPFPTEGDHATDTKLRQAGAEFGATTGRARRCGWFDAVMARYAVDLNGTTEVALTKLDALDRFESIKVCVGYRLGGKTIEHVPANVEEIQELEAIYETFSGWGDRAVAGLTEYERLPEAARAYVNRLQELIGARISIISTGKERSDIIAL